ncbi:hypothetical protein MHU86_21038 [Fragilaria crotonensis]|nr:hypothetical protein MHU86_21038 [Fragilaria crotonensis]
MVLSLARFLALEQSNHAYSNLADELYVTATKIPNSLKEPNLFVITQTEQGNFETATSDDERGDGSNIVIDALRYLIVKLSWHRIDAIPVELPKSSDHNVCLTLRSHIDLCKSATWAMLGDTEESRATFESQVPVLLSVLHSHAQVFSPDIVSLGTLKRLLSCPELAVSA